MNAQEIRHARSIARHIEVHLKSLLASMVGIQRLTEKDVDDFPVQKMAERFQKDWAVCQREVDAVLADMLPELGVGA